PGAFFWGWLNALYFHLDPFMLGNRQVIANNYAPGSAGIVMHRNAIRIGNAPDISLQGIAFLHITFNQLTFHLDAIIDTQEYLELFGLRSCLYIGRPHVLTT